MTDPSERFRATLSSLLYFSPDGGLAEEGSAPGETGRESAGAQKAAEGVSAAVRPAGAARVEKFDGPAIEPIELLNIRIRVEILSEFRKFCQNSSEIQKFEDLSTFSKLFIEILRNSH